MLRDCLEKPRDLRPIQLSFKHVLNRIECQYCSLEEAQHFANRTYGKTGNFITPPLGSFICDRFHVSDVFHVFRKWEGLEKKFKEVVQCTPQNWSVCSDLTKFPQADFPSFTSQEKKKERNVNQRREPVFVYFFLLCKTACSFWLSDFLRSKMFM